MERVMKSNRRAYLLSLILCLSSCSVNILPPLEVPKSLVLNVPTTEEKGLGKKFLENDPVYLSGIFVSAPYRASRIYSCDKELGLSSSGYEWVGSFESQFESEIDRVLRETYPEVKFVSKESGAFSKSELSLKVYKFCLNDSDSGREISLKALVSFTPYGGKEQRAKLIDINFKDDSSASMSVFLSQGFGMFFKDLGVWLEEVDSKK